MYKEYSDINLYTNINNIDMVVYVHEICIVLLRITYIINIRDYRDGARKVTLRAVSFEQIIYFILEIIKYFCDPNLIIGIFRFRYR